MGRSSERESKNFRWHDLRHSLASWHLQNGTPLFVLQELGVSESVEMVRRYAQLAADHLAPCGPFERLERAGMKIYGRFTAQCEN